MEDDLLHHQQQESVKNFHVKGMESVIATVSGYHGTQRFNLIKLISVTGASYVGYMSQSVTHLVCWRFEGRKYELAKKCKMVIVNHRWVEECVKKGRRVSEKPYTFQSGEETGPLLLDVPMGFTFNQAKSKSKALKKGKRPVIDVDGEDTYDAAWMDSIRFDELGGASTSQPAHSGRVKKRNSASLEPQGNGRRLVKKHVSRKDRLLDSNVAEECKDLKASTAKNRRVILSDSSDVERHQNISDRHTSVIRCSLSGQDNGDARDDVEEIEHVNDDNQNARDLGAPPSLLATTPEKLFDAACLDLIDVDAGNRPPASSDLSCVICWTDFSSTRGVLQCGHRFCFACIQNWADHMASRGKSSTCPLCKASFTCITRVEDALTSDQKIYSLSIPHDSSKMDLYILPDETYAPSGPTNNPSAQVCCQCTSREPEDLLIKCNFCQIRCVHIYCLDPPLFPWTCVHCKDLQMLYLHNR